MGSTLDQGQWPSRQAEPTTFRGRPRRRQGKSPGMQERWPTGLRVAALEGVGLFGASRVKRPQESKGPGFRARCRSKHHLTKLLGNVGGSRRMLYSVYAETSSRGLSFIVAKNGFCNTSRLSCVKDSRTAYIRHTYMHTGLHTYIRTYVRTYIHTYIHTYMRMSYVRTHAGTCMHKIMHACIHARITSKVHTYVDSIYI